MTKYRTEKQAATAHQRAIAFATNVLQDEDLADELESLDTQGYADRKGITIVNPPLKRRTTTMANGTTKQDLQDQVDQLTQENEDLQAALDAIADIVSPEDTDGDDEDEDFGY
jgi:hypothetical protein